MKILSYQFSDMIQPGWNFEKVEFGRINLLVGQSASGKTRFTNTLFNIGSIAVSTDEKELRPGHWEIKLEQNGSTYKWILKTTATPFPSTDIAEEIISMIDGAKETILVERNDKTFLFKGKNIPKLSMKSTSISLLREEKEIQPLYTGFSSILRRRFFENIMDKESKVEPIDPLFVKAFQTERNEHTKRFILMKHPLNYRLYFMSKYYKDEYSIINDYFVHVFPFVKKISIMDVTELIPDLKVVGKAPVVCVTEKNIKKPIQYSQLSSGMQKVLLVITDIVTLTDGSIYIIDEYENSLGVNAIEFLPSFLDETNRDIQFFITSHHPYIINNIDPKDWYILHRTGTNVKISSGDANIKRFGKSKQQAFIKLINDPIFIDGVE